ncbi:hypothetical protein AB0A77_27380 [Streptomyces varsoviensis]|uniref:hypothetical protein n=1 Tax=Streptomyces varsoviensis TaxID=67373 RepID=UPI0034046E89
MAYNPNGWTTSLGCAVVDSPRLAMRCVLKRVTDVADQWHAGPGGPSWALEMDSFEYEQGLDQLAAGRAYVFEVSDGDGTQYVVSATPTPQAVTGRGG